MTFDPDSGRVALYGGHIYVQQGAKQSVPLGVMWRQDESGWIPICGAATPQARYVAAFAYDPSTHRYVIAGGAFSIRQPSLDQYETLTREVWSCDGMTWSPAGLLPDARVGAQMIYDPVRGALVLAGGVDETGASVDTTVMSTDGGATWTQLGTTPFPTGSNGTALAYDDNGRQILALEQKTSPPRNSGAAPTSDTLWSLPSTGASWDLVCDNCSGTPRRDAAIVHVSGSRETYLLNGNPGSGAELEGTWVLDQGHWLEVAGDLPMRDSVGVTYDPVQDAIVAYGGNGLSCDGINGNCLGTWQMSGH